MWGSQIRKGGKQYPDWTGSSWSEVSHLRLRVCVSCLFHLTVSSFVLSLSRACLVVFRSCTSLFESSPLCSVVGSISRFEKPSFNFKNHLCSECCAILYIWTCFDSNQFHLWALSCQIGLFVWELPCAEWIECCVMGCVQINPQQSKGCVSRIRQWVAWVILLLAV